MSTRCLEQESLLGHDRNEPPTLRSAKCKNPLTRRRGILRPACGAGGAGADDVARSAGAARSQAEREHPPRFLNSADVPFPTITPRSVHDQHNFHCHRPPGDGETRGEPGREAPQQGRSWQRPHTGRATEAWNPEQEGVPAEQGLPAPRASRPHTGRHRVGTGPLRGSP